MMRKRREIGKSHEPWPEIPFDLVIEILARLPAKSLMRFKSVSKVWLSLICSQYFNNRFLKVSSSLPRLYMWLGFENSHRGDILLSSSSSSSSNVTSTSFFVVGQEFTNPAMEGYSVSQVFRGLMCFIEEERAQIYNTSTRQLVVLQGIEESDMIGDGKFKTIMYHIGHDPIHDQYKVFCTVSRPPIIEQVGDMATYMSEHWVLLLGGGGDVSSRQWRKIPCRCPPHQNLTEGLNIKGRSSIHYLARIRLSYTVLMSFDMSSEEFSMLQIPEDAVWPRVDLIEYGGRVSLLSLDHEGVMELWVMEDAEKNRWSSRKTLKLDPSLITNSILLRLLGTTRNGEIILVPRSTNRAQTQETSLFYVLYYNLEKNHTRKVEIKDTSNRYLTKIWDVIGWDDTDNLLHL